MKIYEIKTQSHFEIELKRKAGEELLICPKCSHERKKKNVKCFSWNHEKNVGRCSHCESSFVIKREVQDEEKKVYARPKFNNRTELSEKLVNWFFKRGITQQTIIDMKVTESVEFMPQTNNNENAINFNYFRNNELINIKYRDGRKNFKLVKDAELIFYNIDAIAESEECMICEGEIDALSWIEAGYKFVVSVPNGASKNSKMEYLDNCYEYFQNKTKIYLSTDNDEPGYALREELARRLGYERCFKLDIGQFKDANEVLCQNGSESLLKCLEKPQEYPIEGVFSIDDVWEDIEHIYEHGLPEGSKTGDRYFDSYLRFMPGELTTVTGVPTHGKSIMLDQISLGLCFNSNWKFGIFSPESFPMPIYYTRLIKRITGKKFSNKNLTKDEVIRVKNWLRERYHMILPSENFTLDTILAKAKQLVLRKGINALILDPWNRIEILSPQNRDPGAWIIECMAKIIRFAQTSGVHVFLVAHPTKMPKKEKSENYVVPNLYSISGSAHFFNMTQNGFTVYRDYEEEKTYVYIQKVKWEHLGELGRVEYVYSKENARFYPEFGLSSGNWLDGMIETLATEPKESFEQERDLYNHQINFQSAMFDQKEVTTDEEDDMPF